MSPTTIGVKVKSGQTVTVVLDIATARNLLLALTNALQGGWAKKKKKKKGGKGGKGAKGGKGKY